MQSSRTSKVIKYHYKTQLCITDIVLLYYCYPLANESPLCLSNSFPHVPAADVTCLDLTPARLTGAEAVVAARRAGRGKRVRLFPTCGDSSVTACGPEPKTPAGKASPSHQTVVAGDAHGGRYIGQVKLTVIRPLKKREIA